MRLLNQSLQAFITVVRIGTVHGAAKELHLTQTGVTQRIRTLEKGLGITLFLRSRKGMALTKEGEALLRYCKAAEDLEGEALSQILGSGVERSIELTLTGPTSVMTARVVDQCVSLYKKWPLLYLHFAMMDSSSERINMVRSGRASFSIIPPEQVPNEMDSKILKPDKYVLVGSPMWRGRKMSDILGDEKVIDFDDKDPTTLNYLKKFDLVGKLKKQRLFVNNNEAIIQLFSKGVGFGTLTQEIAKPHLEAGKLITLNGGAVLEDSLALTWYPRPQKPDYFTDIIEAIR